MHCILTDVWLNLCAMVGEIAISLPQSKMGEKKGPIDRSSNWVALLIGIRSDPKLFAGSGVGSGSGQPGLGMKVKQNFSIKFTISPPNAQFKKKFPKKL
jgi:hypothetical protein